ncbi:regulatory protein RecX [Bacteriovorax sp. Seq25_V]|uniref:regulatory protein RecX n=1 Tax=Bacteriovorax sp. Seq25_V TaxID=1201288 RepID=UPI000389E377|nr:regulatory protein RecX [Bacteriovorax sp. Seq25_V]EQC43503.1 regulatory protein RecX [Bacteriovorax sp. Seq25_V]
MINNILTSEEFQKAYSYSIRILSKRDYSRYKLKIKLQSQGFDESLIEEILNHLESKKFINEQNYAESKIKNWMTKGLSIDHIRQKLEQENISADNYFISQVFDEYKTDEDSQLESLIQKKCRSISSREMFDFNFEKKLIRYLLSKGHSYDMVQKAIDSYIRRFDEEEF